MIEQDQPQEPRSISDDTARQSEPRQWDPNFPAQEIVKKPWQEAPGFTHRSLNELDNSRDIGLVGISTEGFVPLIGEPTEADKAVYAIIWNQGVAYVPDITEDEARAVLSEYVREHSGEQIKVRDAQRELGLFGLHVTWIRGYLDRVTTESQSRSTHEIEQPETVSTIDQIWDMDNVAIKTFVLDRGAVEKQPIINHLLDGGYTEQRAAALVQNAYDAGTIFDVSKKGRRAAYSLFPGKWLEPADKKHDRHDCSVEEVTRAFLNFLAHSEIEITLGLLPNEIKNFLYMDSIDATMARVSTTTVKQVVRNLNAAGVTSLKNGGSYARKADTIGKACVNVASVDKLLEIQDPETCEAIVKMTTDQV